MDRGNVLSGAAFTAVLISAGVFLAVLIGAGFLAVRYTRQAMLGEIEEQIVAEQVLLEDILQTEGSDALVQALDNLKQTVVRRSALGLFDADGSQLAGNLAIAPDFVGWSSVPFSVAHSWSPDGARAETQLYYAYSKKIGNLTLVVGRNLSDVRQVEHALVRTIAIAGFVVVLVMLGTGYLLSSRSQRKLEDLDATLVRIADGDMTARVAVPPGNDQLDRIARRVNANLETLTRLMISTRATAAAVAHDLKSPLSRAYLGLGRALARIEAGQDPRPEIEDTQAELEGMNGIFNTFLRLSRIEASADGAQFTRIDLGVLLDDLAETYAMVAEDNGQSFVFQRPNKGNFVITGDATMLQQMVVNLFQNAVTHGKEGNEICVGLDRDAHIVRLTVADTGPGIPEAARNDVFEPFHRLDPSRRKPGSGLGLALVRAIAERHGARITLADNAPGLRVTVEFGAAIETNH